MSLFVAHVKNEFNYGRYWRVKKWALQYVCGSESLCLSLRSTRISAVIVLMLVPYAILLHETYSL